MDFKNLRKDYKVGELNRKDLKLSPYDQFRAWIYEAIEKKLIEPTAMTLATCTLQARSSSRVVLMRHFDEKGLVFFTNYNSRKALEIEANPFASANFWWRELEKQIMIEGHVEKISNKESDEYFESRPRKSQLAAWASDQDKIIDSREILIQKYELLEKKFEGKVVLRPNFWGGFRIIPERFEFWQGRQNRLHDRFVYHFEEGNWEIDRLSP